MLFPIVSTMARCPPRPAHSVPTKAAFSDVLPAGGAAKTPTTGKTVPVLVLGQFPPLLRLPPVPVYHRRLLGLNLSSSLEVGKGWTASIVGWLRLRTASPFNLPRKQSTSYSSRDRC